MKVRIFCLVCAAPILWGTVHACNEDEGPIPLLGQMVALPPQTHQPETHVEFEFSYIPAALTAGLVGGSVTVAPLPGSIVISGSVPTIEGVRSVLHPGVT